MDKQAIMQQAISLLMAHADEDFVGKKEALDAGANLHNLMIEMREQPQDINVPQSELKYVHDTDVVNMGSNKSAEELLRASIPFSTWQYNSRTEQRIVGVIEKYSEPLQSRITQLEKQNSELREALENIISTQSKVTSFGSSAAYREAHQIAEQALKPKDDG